MDDTQLVKQQLDQVQQVVSTYDDQQLQEYQLEYEKAKKALEDGMAFGSHNEIAFMAITRAKLEQDLREIESRIMTQSTQVEVVGSVSETKEPVEVKATEEKGILSRVRSFFGGLFSGKDKLSKNGMSKDEITEKTSSNIKSTYDDEYTKEYLKKAKGAGEYALDRGKDYREALNQDASDPIIVYYNLKEAFNAQTLMEIKTSAPLKKQLKAIIGEDANLDHNIITTKGQISGLNLDRFVGSLTTSISRVDAFKDGRAIEILRKLQEGKDSAHGGDDTSDASVAEALQQVKLGFYQHLKNLERRYGNVITQVQVPDLVKSIDLCVLADDLSTLQDIVQIIDNNHTGVELFDKSNPMDQEYIKLANYYMAMWNVIDKYKGMVMNKDTGMTNDEIDIENYFRTLEKLGPVGGFSMTELEQKEYTKGLWKRKDKEGLLLAGLDKARWNKHKSNFVEGK